MTNAKKPTYGEAAAELESILDRIEEGEIDVDELASQVERAALLIQVCRDKLTATEVKVKKVVQEMLGAPEPATDEAADDRLPDDRLPDGRLADGTRGRDATAALRADGPES